MQRYVRQLLYDINRAREEVAWPYIGKDSYEIMEWKSSEEDKANAVTRKLDEWTGITTEELPPEHMLSDDEVESLFEVLNKMLDVYNCVFVVQFDIPIRIQYETIRQNMDQEFKVLQWHMGFFEHCKPGTKHRNCPSGEYCHCAFYKELFNSFEPGIRTHEEQRLVELNIEIDHLKKKHGDRWKKYYPYHLDPDFDDRDGNPYDYGYEDWEDDYDDWWRK